VRAGQRADGSHVLNEFGMFVQYYACCTRTGACRCGGQSSRAHVHYVQCVSSSKINVRSTPCSLLLLAPSLPPSHSASVLRLSRLDDTRQVCGFQERTEAGVRVGNAPTFTALYSVSFILQAHQRPSYHHPRIPPAPPPPCPATSRRRKYSTDTLCSNLHPFPHLVRAP